MSNPQNKKNSQPSLVIDAMYLARTNWEYIKMLWLFRCQVDFVLSHIVKQVESDGNFEYGRQFKQNITTLGAKKRAIPTYCTFYGGISGDYLDDLQRLAYVDLRVKNPLYNNDKAFLAKMQNQYPDMSELQEPYIYFTVVEAVGRLDSDRFFQVNKVGERYTLRKHENWDNWPEEVRRAVRELLGVRKPSDEYGYQLGAGAITFKGHATLFDLHASRLVSEEQLLQRSNSEVDMWTWGAHVMFGNDDASRIQRGTETEPLKRSLEIRGWAAQCNAEQHESKFVHLQSSDGKNFFVPLGSVDTFLRDAAQNPESITKGMNSVWPIAYTSLKDAQYYYDAKITVEVEIGIMYAGETKADTRVRILIKNVGRDTCVEAVVGSLTIQKLEQFKSYVNGPALVVDAAEITHLRHSLDIYVKATPLSEPQRIDAASNLLRDECYIGTANISSTKEGQKVYKLKHPADNSQMMRFYVQSPKDAKEAFLALARNAAANNRFAMEQLNWSDVEEHLMLTHEDKKLIEILLQTISRDPHLSRRYEQIISDEVWKFIIGMRIGDLKNLAEQIQAAYNPLKRRLEEEDEQKENSNGYLARINPLARKEEEFDVRLLDNICRKVWNDGQNCEILRRLPQIQQIQDLDTSLITKDHAASTGNLGNLQINEKQLQELQNAYRQSYYSTHSWYENLAITCPRLVGNRGSRDSQQAKPSWETFDVDVAKAMKSGKPLEKALADHLPETAQQDLKEAYKNGSLLNGDSVTAKNQRFFVTASSLFAAMKEDHNKVMSEDEHTQKILHETDPSSKLAKFATWAGIKGLGKTMMYWLPLMILIAHFNPAGCAILVGYLHSFSWGATMIGWLSVIGAKLQALGISGVKLFGSHIFKVHTSGSLSATMLQTAFQTWIKSHTSALVTACTKAIADTIIYAIGCMMKVWFTIFCFRKAGGVVLDVVYKKSLWEALAAIRIPNEETCQDPENMVMIDGKPEPLFTWHKPKWYERKLSLDHARAVPNPALMQKFWNRAADDHDENDEDEDGILGKTTTTEQFINMIDNRLLNVTFTVTVNVLYQTATGIFENVTVRLQNVGLKDSYNTMLSQYGTEINASDNGAGATATTSDPYLQEINVMTMLKEAFGQEWNSVEKTDNTRVIAMVRNPDSIQECMWKPISDLSQVMRVGDYLPGEFGNNPTKKLDFKMQMCFMDPALAKNVDEFQLTPLYSHYDKSTDSIFDTDVIQHFGRRVVLKNGNAAIPSDIQDQLVYFLYARSANTTSENKRIMYYYFLNELGKEYTVIWSDQNTLPFDINREMTRRRFYQEQLSYGTDSDSNNNLPMIITESMIDKKIEMWEQIERAAEREVRDKNKPNYDKWSEDRKTKETEKALLTVNSKDQTEPTLTRNEREKCIKIRDDLIEIYEGLTVSSSGLFGRWSMFGRKSTKKKALPPPDVNKMVTNFTSSTLISQDSSALVDQTLSIKFANGWFREFVEWVVQEEQKLREEEKENRKRADKKSDNGRSLVYRPREAVTIEKIMEYCKLDGPTKSCVSQRLRVS